MTPERSRLSVMTHLALFGGRSASALSRRMGKGRGSQVGGKLAYRLWPRTLDDLARGRTTLLVSATNGKSTTATLAAAAISTLGPTAFNATGANMEEGLVVALDAERSAPYAVLETDEAYLDVVVRATRPRVITLMNLGRDFLERGVRAKRLADLWRQTLATIDWPCTVVADTDDALVAWAVRGYSDVVWVSGEDAFIDDAMICRDCYVRLDRSAPPHWQCVSCGFERAKPDWWLEGDFAIGPTGVVEIPSALPGHAASMNSLFALASSVVMGVPGQLAAAEIARIDNVDGRYAPHRYDNHEIRVLLAKNPASWTASIETLVAARAADPSRSIVLMMGARGHGGGQDTAMLWDAPFERLAGIPVTTTGSRGDELALRLAVAGVDVRRETSGELMNAVRTQPAGPIDVVANWPAFNALLDTIGRGA